MAASRLTHGCLTAAFTSAPRDATRQSVAMIRAARYTAVLLAGSHRQAARAKVLFRPYYFTQLPRDAGDNEISARSNSEDFRLYLPFSAAWTWY